MNLLFLSNLYPPVVFGGYEILTQQVADEMRRRGHEVFVQTSDFGADTCSGERWVSRDLRLTTPFPRPGEDARTPDFGLVTLERTARHNRQRTADLLEQLPGIYSNRRGPDLVFAWNLNRLTLGSLFAAQQLQLPLYWTLNDLHARQFWVAPDLGRPRYLARRLWERFVLPHATMRNLSAVRTTVISHALHRQLLDAHVPVQDAQVVYQGIPIDRFPFQPARRRPDETLRLLYVGQLSAAKGVHTVLEALSRLPKGIRQRCELTIVGDGVASYERQLRQLADGVDCRVDFAGRLPHDRIAEAHRSHHVLVFPSEWQEPFGLAHLEAMASGCAVVSTATGGTAELVRHGRNCLVFTAGESRSLASRLVTLFSSEKLRLDLAHQARHEVETRFSLTAYVDRLERFLGTDERSAQWTAAA